MRVIGLVAGLMVLGALARGAGAQQMTAGEAWTKMQHRYADARPENTVDTLKGGDPSTKVTGIVTTFLDTMDVLREAVRLGDNLVISHEPTFYNHPDDVKGFVNDPVYLAKRAYIDEHHLVVYRLHDEIHADPAGDHILMGVYEALGWAGYPKGTAGWDKGTPAMEGRLAQYFVTIPPTTLGELAKMLAAKLGGKTVRVDGDPGQTVTHLAVIPGAGGLEKQVRALNVPGVDALVAGEAAEWEGVEYVRDAVAQGRKKGMILLGHEVSEEPGMEQCAKELRVLFPGVRVDHVLAGQALWGVDQPVVPKTP